MTEEKTNLRILPRLFLSTLFLSAFTFGGGYIIIALMEKKFVNEYHWIDQQEMLDLAAIAQSCPGAVAVNGAIVVGYKLAGLPGILTAVTATVLPPLVILSLISLCYSAFRSSLLAGWMLNGMQAGVAAVIFEVVWEMTSGLIREKNRSALAVMAASFFAGFFLGINVILIILVCALGGVLVTLRREKRKKGGPS